MPRKHNSGLPDAPARPGHLLNIAPGRKMPKLTIPSRAHLPSNIPSSEARAKEQAEIHQQLREIWKGYAAALRKRLKRAGIDPNNLIVKLSAFDPALCINAWIPGHRSFDLNHPYRDDPTTAWVKIGEEATLIAKLEAERVAKFARTSTEEEIIGYRPGPDLYFPAYDLTHRFLLAEENKEYDLVLAVFTLTAVSRDLVNLAYDPKLTPMEIISSIRSMTMARLESLETQHFVRSESALTKTPHEGFEEIATAVAMERHEGIDAVVEFVVALLQKYRPAVVYGSATPSAALMARWPEEIARAQKWSDHYAAIRATIAKTEADRPRRIAAADLQADDWKDMTTEELTHIIWMKPMVELERMLGVSNVMIGKRARKLGIPMPGKGFWNKVDAGKLPHPMGTPFLS